jgi:hypothetical protein
MHVNRMGYFVLGALMGMAAQYFLDPVSGRGRRAVARDKSWKYARKARVAVGKRVRDFSNRAAGTVAELRSGFGRRRSAARNAEFDEAVETASMAEPAVD